jgi:RHS repeat-associated protein
MMRSDPCSFSVAFWNGYKFTGKERDSESGLDNFGKRYYASSMGRFSSTDPGPYIWRDPQTLNRYAYTRNNPLR